MPGVSTIGLSQMVANSLITGFLMLYITGYSGVYMGITVFVRWLIIVQAEAMAVKSSPGMT